MSRTTDLTSDFLRRVFDVDSAGQPIAHTEMTTVHRRCKKWRRMRRRWNQEHVVIVGRLRAEFGKRRVS